MTSAVQVVHPPGYAPERAYAARVLLGEFLGLEIEVGDGPVSEWELRCNGGTITVPDIFFQVHERDYLTAASLPSDGALYGDDLFGNAFYLLTRYEEAVLPDRDEHGRFPAEAALAVRAGLIDRPLVNDYAEELWRKLRGIAPRLERRQRSFRIVPSHDVDTPYSTLRQRLSALRHGQLRAALPHDPFDTFDLLMDESERRGLRGAFYFIAEDAPYSLEEPRIRELLRRIHRRGHEIGFHASYAAFQDPVANAPRVRPAGRGLPRGGHRPGPVGRQAALSALGAGDVGGVGAGRARVRLNAHLHEPARLQNRRLLRVSGLRPAGPPRAAAARAPARADGHPHARPARPARGRADGADRPAARAVPAGRRRTSPCSGTTTGSSLAASGGSCGRRWGADLTRILYSADYELYLGENFLPETEVLVRADGGAARRLRGGRRADHAVLRRRLPLALPRGGRRRVPRGRRGAASRGAAARSRRPGPPPPALAARSAGERALAGAARDLPRRRPRRSGAAPGPRRRVSERVAATGRARLLVHRLPGRQLRAPAGPRARLRRAARDGLRGRLERRAGPRPAQRGQPDRLPRLAGAERPAARVVRSADRLRSLRPDRRGAASAQPPALPAASRPDDPGRLGAGADARLAPLQARPARARAGPAAPARDHLALPAARRARRRLLVQLPPEGGRGARAGGSTRLPRVAERGRTTSRRSPSGSSLPAERRRRAASVRAARG